MMDLAIGWFDPLHPYREEQPPAHGAYTVEGQAVTRPPEHSWQHRTSHPREHTDDLSRDFLLQVRHRAIAIRHQIGCRM